MRGLARTVYAVGAAAMLVRAGAVPGAPPRRFVSTHSARIGGTTISYQAAVEEFVVNGAAGKPAANLFATSYLRSDGGGPRSRPVVFVFNGGPSYAAIGLHAQFGPLTGCPGSMEARAAPICITDNPDSLLDVADLVMFDPVETGLSRMLPGADRQYFYSTDGDADALAQLVKAWLARHGRMGSPRYFLGESYGSIRQVVATDLLAKRGLPVDGEIILGDSIFLMETSRRTHNIVSSAVSLPLLAMTAAYHGKADMHGKTAPAYLDEVYQFALTDYLEALGRGYTLDDAGRQGMAGRLERYTGIPASYFLAHGLTVSKQDFNTLLLPGQVLDSNDTRIARPAPGTAAHGSAARENANARDEQFYGTLLRTKLGATVPGIAYRAAAPESFERWEWGSGCNDYLRSAGLCSTAYVRRSIFVDYDWPEVLKRQFAAPNFRTMIVAGYYDGLSSIGTHRYLAAQLGYPADRFTLHEYAGGHATAADPAAHPKIVADVRAFLAGQR